MSNLLSRFWTQLFPPPPPDYRTDAQRHYDLAQVFMVGEDELAQYASAVAREIEPDNPLAAIYDLYTSLYYVRTLNPYLPQTRTEHLARDYCMLVILHVVRTETNIQERRVPQWSSVENVLWMDPDATLALLRKSPVRSVQRWAKRLEKTSDAGELREGLLLTRRTYARA